MRAIKSKLKNSRGAALILVIFAMLMITAGVGIVSLQVNNQIVSNKNRSNKSEQSYLAEAGVEKTIADIYEAIESKLKDLNKGTEPKTNADKYIVYCLKESQKYFIRANENMPEGHKDIINNQILKVYTDEELIKNAVAPYTNTSSSISKVLDGVNNLKIQSWYNGVANNYKKGIGSNVDMGVYYLNLAKETLGHMNSRDSAIHTSHTKGTSQGSEDKTIYLSQAELDKVTNALSIFRTKVYNFKESPSERDSVFNQSWLLAYIDTLNKELTISNINSGNIKLNYILAKLEKIKEVVKILKPQGNEVRPTIDEIYTIENEFKKATTYLSNKELLAKATTELSNYGNIIGEFVEGSGKNKLVTKAEVTSSIGKISMQLKAIDINNSTNDTIAKALNEILDELIKLQVDVTNLKPKGNSELSSIAEINSIKRYLIEVKCNIVRTDYYEKPTDTVTEVQLGKSKEILVSIPAYTHYIDGKSVYKRDAIEFKVIAIIDEYRVNGSTTEIIREIRPTTVDIVAYDSNDKNKTKANVTFYTETLNDGSKFMVYDHKVNSWDR